MVVVGGMENVGGSRDCAEKTRKGSLLEDGKLPVFTTRARSVAKVLAAPAMSVGVDQGRRTAVEWLVVAALRLARVLEADLLISASGYGPWMATLRADEAPDVCQQHRLVGSWLAAGTCWGPPL